MDNVIDIDQSPIGRTPRSNPATYTGFFTPIREIFLRHKKRVRVVIKMVGLALMVKVRRCEACHGDGLIKVEMHFLPDVYVTCDVCKGKRYNRETLEVRYKGKNIYEILQMTVEEARQFFDPVPVVARRLQTLIDVGLSYISLGQSATTLSGGKRNGLSYRRNYPNATPVARFIFWMSLPPVCILRTSNNYWRFSIVYATTATPSW